MGQINREWEQVEQRDLIDILSSHIPSAPRTEQIFLPSSDDVSSRCELTPTIQYDPNSLKSMAGAAMQIAAPFSRLLINRTGNFGAADNGDVVRTTPDPFLPNEVACRFRASMLPEGPIIPSSVGAAAGRAYDAAVAKKPELITATATAVVAAIALSGTPSVSPERASATSAAVSRPLDAIKPKEAKELKVQMTSATISYVAPEKLPVKVVANDLHMSVDELVRANPGLNARGYVEPGMVVGGTVKSSVVELKEPKTVEQLAVEYGASIQAIESVNQVNKDGFVDVAVVVPGRQIVPVTSEVNTDALAEHLGLSLPGIEELNRVNLAAPEGQLVVPLYRAIAPQLSDPASVAAVAEGIIPPGTVLPPVVEPTVPQVSVPEVTSTTTTPSTTTSSPASTTTSSEAITTTSQPEASTTTTAPAPEATVPPVPEALAPPAMVERPATVQEKMAADIEAFHKALDHLIMTGDAGPANHIVTYSPVFKAYNLSKEMQDKGYRSLPPANLLGIPGLNYEFSLDTPDKERNGTSQTIVTILAAAYAFEFEKQSNPEFAARFPNACIRVGDVSALKGHESHAGPNSDMTSVMECNVQGGHGSADGPVFWINKTEGGIDQRVTNKNYSAQLDKLVLQRLLGLQINGAYLIRNILYNAPHLNIKNVLLHSNHSHHIHVNGAGGQDHELKVISIGGNRPELNLDGLRLMILMTYVDGGGIDGISRGLTVWVPADQAVALSPSPETTAPVAPIEQPTNQVPPAESQPAALATELDYMTVLPQTAGIPSEIGVHIVPSKYFTAIELAAQIKNESNFNPNAKSPVGAKGLAQFMPGTWEVLGRDDLQDPDLVASPYSITEALDAQRRYMDGQYELIQKLINEGRIKGDPRQLTLAAYNAGLGNVKKYGGVPPFAETKGYIKKIDQTIQDYVEAVDRERPN